MEHRERPKEQREGQPESKPLLARLLQRLGVPTSSRTDGVIGWLQILAIAGLLAWVLMSFVVVRMQVPTGSMVPTIQQGDSFFLDRISFLLGLKQPQPGDIIVFWRVDESKLCRSGFQIGRWEVRWGEPKPCRERYVKRLVAVGPATVKIHYGQLFMQAGGDSHWEPLSGPAFARQYLCDSSASTLIKCEFEVPAGHYFVLGDNTRESYDSRYWGPVDKKEFIGEPFLRVWPPERIGPMNGYFGSPR